MIDRRSVLILLTASVLIRPASVSAADCITRVHAAVRVSSSRAARLAIRTAAITCRSCAPSSAKASRTIAGAPSLIANRIRRRAGRTRSPTRRRPNGSPCRNASSKAAPDALWRRVSATPAGPSRPMALWWHGALPIPKGTPGSGRWRSARSRAARSAPSRRRSVRYRTPAPCRPVRRRPRNRYPGAPSPIAAPIMGRDGRRARAIAPPRSGKP